MIVLTHSVEHVLSSDPRPVVEHMLSYVIILNHLHQWLETEAPLPATLLPFFTLYQVDRQMFVASHLLLFKTVFSTYLNEYPSTV